MANSVSSLLSWPTANLRPPTQAFVRGLNLIDVIFAKSPRVLQLWHEYYDLLCSDPPNIALWEHKYIDMLTEMARDLRYAKLKQTDIEKFYKPVAHGATTQMNEKIQVELLRVLENTFALITIERTKAEKAIKDKQSSAKDRGLQLHPKEAFHERHAGSTQMP